MSESFRYGMPRPPMYGTLPNGMQFTEVDDEYAAFAIECTAEVDDAIMAKYELVLLSPEIIPQYKQRVYVRLTCPDKDIRGKYGYVVADTNKFSIYVETDDGMESSTSWRNLKIID